MSYDLGTAHGTIELEYRGQGAAAKAERDIDAVSKKSKEADRDLKIFGRTLATLGKLGATAALSTLFTQAAAGAASLAIQILGIVPALTSILSLSAALPGFYVGLAAVLGVVKASLNGVGDAITSAFDTDPKKFEEALEKLSPKAKEFAQAFRNDAVPALKAFQQTLQDTFFETSALTSQIPKMLRALQTLSPQLTGLAGDFGRATRSVLDFALGAESIRFVNSAIQATRAGMSEASRAILPVLKGLRDVGSVGLPLLARLGEAIGNVGERFGAWLTEIAADGRLQDWINKALDTLRDLGDIIGYLGSILNSVFQAAEETGGGLLKTIASVTSQFAAFLKSAEGAGAIRELFATLISLARQLAPIVTTLVGTLVSALAPAMRRIAEEVGPVLLQVVEALAPAFAPLATAIADLVIAVAPLLPPLAKLLTLLANLASGAISVLAAELGPLIEVLSQGLLAAFEELAPIITELARNALPLAAEAGVALARAFAPLMPVLVDLARAFAEALIPLLPQIQSASLALIPIIVDLVEAFVELYSSGLRDLIPLLPLLVGAFAKLAPVMLQVMTFGFRLLTFFLQLFSLMRQLPAAIGGFFSAIVSGLVGGLKAAYESVLTIGAVLVNWFSALPERIMGALRRLPGLATALFRNWLDTMATIVGTAAGLIVGIFTKLPGRIMDGLNALPGFLRNLWNTIWANARALFIAGVNAVVTLTRTLPGRVRSALASLGSQIAAVARSAWSSFRSAVSSGISSVVALVRGVPGRIRSALGNVGGMLYSSGRAIINGLISGISSGVGRVMGILRDLANRARAAFDNALSIFSPSRVFFESGVSIDEGLILGIKKKMGEVARIAQTLAQTVINPTISLPNASGMALAGISTLPAVRQAVASSEDRGGEFGPYSLEIDQGVLLSFTIDAITGNPRVVSKSAAEGDRKGSYMGSGKAA
jgi:phage-related protein